MTVFYSATAITHSKFKTFHTVKVDKFKRIQENFKLIYSLAIRATTKLFEQLTLIAMRELSVKVLL